MSILSVIKCIICLTKCSKYLYYIKKAICIAVIFMAVFVGMLVFMGENKKLKKLIKELKAVI